MTTGTQLTSNLSKQLLRIAKIFWPELGSRSPERKAIGVGEVIATLYSIPFAVAGLVWLITETDLNWILKNPGDFALFALLIVIFNQLGFFLIIELRANRYGSADGALTGLPLWAGVLLFGPTIFWLPVFWIFYQLAINWRNAQSKSARWGQLRNTIMSLTSATLVPMAAFRIYLTIGGQAPLTELTLDCVLLAMVLFGIFFLGYTLFWAPYLGYLTWIQITTGDDQEIGPTLKFFFLAIGLPQLANPLLHHRDDFGCLPGPSIELVRRTQPSILPDPREIGTAWPQHHQRPSRYRESSQNPATTHFKHVPGW